MTGKKLIKATCTSEPVTMYFLSKYAAQQTLGINAGQIKMICEGENNVKRGKSKVNGKKYTFEYIDQLPETAQLAQVEKKKRGPKPKDNTKELEAEFAQLFC